MMRRSRLAAALSAAALLSGCRRAPDTDPRMVAEWMHSLYGAVRVERIGPTVASRVLAYGSISLYAGLAATSPNIPPITAVLNGLTEFPAANPGQTYDPTITAVTVERTVMDSLLAEALPTT